MDALWIFAAGWFWGAAVQWFYFHKSDLIRDEQEWYAAKARKGAQ